MKTGDEMVKRRARVWSRCASHASRARYEYGVDHISGEKEI